MIVKHIRIFMNPIPILKKISLGDETSKKKYEASWLLFNNYIIKLEKCSYATGKKAEGQ